MRRSGTNLRIKGDSMKTFLLILLGFVIGGVAGALGGGLLGVGAGAGVGIVTGLKAGACLTLDAARAEGLISADQEAGLLQATARQFASEDLPEGPDTSEIDCAAVVADLRRAAD
jgi:hypothetical protein